MALVQTKVYAYERDRSVYCMRSKRQMNDPSEEKTKYCFLCDRLTLFCSTLKDSFVLADEDDYWI